MQAPHSASATMPHNPSSLSCSAVDSTFHTCRRVPQGVPAVPPCHSSLPAVRPALLSTSVLMYSTRLCQARVWPLLLVCLGTCGCRLHTNVTDVHAPQTSYHLSGGGGTWGIAHIPLSALYSLHSPTFPAPTTLKLPAVLPTRLPSLPVTAAPPEVGITTSPPPPPLELGHTWAKYPRSPLNQNTSGCGRLLTPVSQTTSYMFGQCI